MPKCNNRNLSELLHAYELGMLSENERREFEEHLLSCDECSRRAVDFEVSVKLLRRDNDIAQAVTRASETDSAEKPGKGKTAKIWRYLIAAVLVTVVGVPVVKYFTPHDNVSLIAQSIDLNPLRSEADNVIDLTLPGDIEIRFVVEGATPSDIFGVKIAMIGNEPVWASKTFSDFNVAGQGLIVIPVELLEKGYYSIEVFRSDVDSSVAIVQYLFKAE